jgi:hypothetical protein
MLLDPYRHLVDAVVILANKDMDRHRAFLVSPRAHSYLGGWPCVFSLQDESWLLQTI